MPSGQYRWVKSSPKKQRISDMYKSEVTKRAQEFVETVLKPRYVNDPPADPQCNYIVDIFIHWYHSYLYFSATYCCVGPNVLYPSFEYRFARMEFTGINSFHLAFMRHNGEWVGLYNALSLDECLNAIRDDAYFQM